MPARNNEPSNTATWKRYVLYLAGAILITILIAAYFLFISPAQPKEPKAAIIDQLASTKLAEAIRHENQTFIETTRQLLYQRFSVVDYYSNNATVESYRQLTSAGYRLIVWRAHSALNMDPKYIAISSTDKYTRVNYDQYLDNDQLTLCNITGDPDNLYFGITPKFVEQVMDGKFEDTVIVLMSCNGLRYDYDATAEAFEAKGARVFMSWDGWISPSDNDVGSSLLLRYLINDNNTVGIAVSKIPQYFVSGLGYSQMQYDPYPEASDYVIPDYRKITLEAGSMANAVVVSVRIKRQWGFQNRIGPDGFMSLFSLLESVT